MIDIGKLSDYGGIGGLVAVVSWWTRYSILKEQLRRERVKKLEQEKEQENVAQIINATNIVRIVRDHGSRLGEIEVAKDRYERWFEEQDRRLSAAERFIVNAKHSPEA